jgi:CHAD domain-containing protein
VRAAACGEIADALQVLWAQSRPGDEAVHQVRKDLKKARAALRLLRDAVGEAAYSRENIELRDAARPLSALRDAVVGLELARELIAKEKSPARRAMLQELRRKLHADRLQSREKLLRGATLAAIEQALEHAGQRVEYWRVPLEDRAVLRAGFERVYRKGRKALSKARADASTKWLHESRKQVKYLREALAVVADDGSGRAAKFAKRAQAVADRLGDGHDLAMLEARLAALPADSSKPEQKLRARIEARRVKLQKSALKKARRLYRRKPAAFLDRVLS